MADDAHPVPAPSQSALTEPENRKFTINFGPQHPAAHGVLAMQEINRMALTKPFLLVFVGTALSCLLLGIVSALEPWDARTRWRMASCASYLLGTFLLTIAYHVPRNEALARIDPVSLEAAGRWGEYLAEWVPANHARAGAALLGLIGLMLGR